MPDPFSALIMSIVNQQISSKAANTVCNRLREMLVEITPDNVANASIDNIQKCGMSIRKATYIKGIGDAVVSGELDIAGVGLWTAEMLLIFSLSRPDVVSWGDLAIRRGMMNLYGLKSLSKEQFERYRNRYSPYGSVASLYLWALSVM